MSYMDKRVCMASARERIGEIVPEAMADRIITILDDVLIDFDVTAVQTEAEDLNSAQLLEFYLTAAELQGYAPGTLYGYKRILLKLQEYTKTPFRKMRYENIMSFMKSEKDRGISPVTMENYRHAFNAFFGWLKREEIIAKNPAERVQRFKAPDVMRLPFSDVELRLLDEAALTARDRAIIAFLGATGCRVAEAVSVNREDIEWEHKRLKVMGKGSKERLVYIDDVPKMLVQRYLEERKDEFSALFIGRGSERLTPSGMRKILREIGQRAGVEGVHPHRFRRTLATNLLKSGMPLERVQKILGHTKITTTQRYIYVDDTDVANDYSKYF